MSIGANISVIAVGAVLALALRVHTAGFSVTAVGGVLMVVGVISLMLQIRAIARQRELTSVQAELPATAVLVRRDSQYRDSQYTGNEW
jgi:hypothetical protein